MTKIKCGWRCWHADDGGGNKRGSVKSQCNNKKKFGKREQV